MQASPELIHLLSLGVPMAEAKQRLGLTPPEKSVSAGDSGEGDDRKVDPAPAGTTAPEQPKEPADAPSVDDEAKPAWMP